MPEHESGGGPSRSLAHYGLRPRKRLGQNFLQDRSILPRILAGADVGPVDQVLEIGAGTGVLTRALLERAGRVVAVELDDRLYDLLGREFDGARGLDLWHGDVLRFDPCQHFSAPYKLVGNIPYYVTGPIIRHFLEARCRPDVLVLMVQREVAVRMTASPGKLSLLGVSVQYYARTEIIARVPSSAFFPRPKVDSAIVRMTPYGSNVDADERTRFFEVVRGGFSAPRKQLANSLSAGLAVPRMDAIEMLRQAGIDEVRRAETLSIDEWKRLAQVRNERQAVEEV